MDSSAITTISFHSPDSLHQEVRKLAEQEGVSINQLITLASPEEHDRLPAQLSLLKGIDRR